MGELLNYFSTVCVCGNRLVIATLGTIAGTIGKNRSWEEWLTGAMWNEKWMRSVWVFVLKRNRLWWNLGFFKVSPWIWFIAPYSVEFNNLNWKFKSVRGWQILIRVEFSKIPNPEFLFRRRGLQTMSSNHFSRFKRAGHEDDSPMRMMINWEKLGLVW